MKPWRRQKKTHCPLCNSKLLKVRGRYECGVCGIVLVGDSCKFVDLPQLILGRHDTKKR